MIVNRRERKKETTRANIIECGVELFKEKGFQETSMEEIAERADISKGTLYNYFQNKEAILSAYFQSYIAMHRQDMLAALQDIPAVEARLGHLLSLVQGIFEGEPSLAAIYFRYRSQTLFDSNPYDNPNRSGLENILLEVMKAAQEKGEIRKDISALALARSFLFLTRSRLIESIALDEPLDMVSIKKETIGLFLNGAKAS